MLGRFPGRLACLGFQNCWRSKPEVKNGEAAGIWQCFLGGKAEGSGTHLRRNPSSGRGDRVWALMRLGTRHRTPDPRLLLPPVAPGQGSLASCHQSPADPPADSKKKVRAGSPSFPLVL